MKEFDKLVKTIRILRAPGGCPWDRAQKVANYKRYLLEEAYELIDEIDERSFEAVKEELGDLFLILIVITELFQEKGIFNLNQVLNKVNDKLIVRHPHVFSSKKIKTARGVLSYWIKNKAKIKKRKTVKDRLPLVAPSLLLAELFFKEYAHIHKIRNKKTEITKIFKHLATQLAAHGQAKNKSELLPEIIFKVCNLAFLYNIDLENLLRHRVIKEAKNTRYT
jgi:tetrapyrrole methylase family protein/MazG family protein